MLPAVLCCCLQIIHVNLTSAEPVLLKEGQEVTFTFAVNWLPSTTPFSQRFERYLDYNFFEHKVLGGLTLLGVLCGLPESRGGGVVDAGHVMSH